MNDAPSFGNGLKAVEDWHKLRVRRLQQRGLVPIDKPLNKFAEMVAKNPLLILPVDAPDPLARDVRVAQKKAFAKIKQEMVAKESADDEAQAAAQRDAETSAETRKAKEAQHAALREAVLRDTIGRLEAEQAGGKSKGTALNAKNMKKAARNLIKARSKGGATAQSPLEELD